MFTGIVEETGTVLSFEQTPRAWRLRLAANLVRTGVALGDSLAINGCCLTVAAIEEQALCFDVLEETRRLTNFRFLAPGAVVNLERSLAFGGKMGGHFVTGHIDGTGEIDVFERRGADYYLRVHAPADSARFLIHKGSIAIDGISLTVAETHGDTLAVWIIPHTWQVTNLRGRQAGDRVNLEFDLLGKYVEKLLLTRAAA